jgi:hypothetical protein
MTIQEWGLTVVLLSMSITTELGILIAERGTHQWESRPGNSRM